MNHSPELQEKRKWESNLHPKWGVVFKRSMAMITPPEDIFRGAVFFLIDASGKRLATYRVEDGEPMLIHSGIFSFKQKHQQDYYHLLNVGGVPAVAVPLDEGAEDELYIVAASKLADKHREVFAGFLVGLRAVVRIQLKEFAEQVKQEIVAAAMRSQETDSLMNILVSKLSTYLKGRYCCAVLVDEQGRLSENHWSSHAAVSIDLSFLDRLQFSWGSLITSDMDDMMFVVTPIMVDGHTKALIVVRSEQESPLTDQDIYFIRGLADSVAPAVVSTQRFENVLYSLRRRNTLFEVIKKIHSSMDVDDVLHEVIENIKILYPRMDIDLWLSHDSASSKVPAKQISCTSDRLDISAQAFMQGNLTTGMVEQEEGGAVFTIAAPLRGKQGIYGVLQLSSLDGKKLIEQDIDYVSALADATGNAFENAQLYKQSQNLIQDLILINEMSRQINKSLKLQDVLNFVIEKLSTTFSAKYTCFLSHSTEGGEYVVRATNCADLLGAKLSQDHALVREITEKRSSVIITDANVEESDQSWPFRYSSLMAVPLDGEQAGDIIVIYDEKPNQFTFDDLKLLEIMAQHTRMAIINASLHSELEKMVITDNLTKLHVRKYLYEQIQLSQQTDNRGSLVLIDVDNFKEINDMYGHQVGDEILKQVAFVLQSNLRDTDIAARWGGEEFAVYLPEVGVDTAARIADRIRSYVKEITDPPVTISAGVATWDAVAGFVDLNALVYQADMSLYQAKNGGRDRIVISSKS